LTLPNSGQNVANFSLATTERFTDRDGAKQQRTEWLRVVAFGRLADTCERFLSKGRQVYVEGGLTTRQYQAKDASGKRYRTEIVALPTLLRAFFHEWLVEQRNASVHTVRSYRDTWRLFLRFVAQRNQRTVAQLRLGDLTGSEVGAFLRYMEQERGGSIGTRNCRLAALRSFFGFVAGREPATAEQCAEVLRIPTKKAPLHAPCYLDPPEVEAILAQRDAHQQTFPKRLNASQRGPRQANFRDGGATGASLSGSIHCSPKQKQCGGDKSSMPENSGPSRFPPHYPFLLMTE
jgi:hypothetical protein